MTTLVNVRTPLLLAAGLALGGCPYADDMSLRAEAAALHVCEEKDEDSLSALLRDADGYPIGRVTFASDTDFTTVIVSAELPPDQAGIHGIHLHANSDPSNGEGCIADPDEPPSTHFASVDGHLNPHGAGHSHGDHLGDLPALFFTRSGVASLRFITDRFSVDDVRGAAVILHTGADNYGNVPVGENPDQYQPNSDAATDLTAKTGNGGARIACGVVE